MGLKNNSQETANRGAEDEKGIILGEYLGDEEEMGKLPRMGITITVSTHRGGKY